MLTLACSIEYGGVGPFPIDARAAAAAAGI
jgi:hypothetical protein